MSALRSLAIHIGADVARRGDDRWWPRGLATRDTIARVERIATRLGVDQQHTITGEHATIAAVTHALQLAEAELADDGVLMLTFSGHTERGTGPLPTARWCLHDGGLGLSAIAAALAALPASARILLVCDTCYGAAITGVLAGLQRVIVIAACGEDQMMIDRRRSEFLVRTEALVQSSSTTLAELRAALEADTPDCERPVVWTNATWSWAAPIERTLLHELRPA